MRALPLAPLPLLGRGPVHPWLHADAEGVVVGRLTDAGEVQLVTSARETWNPAEAKAATPPRRRMWRTSRPFRKATQSSLCGMPWT